MPWKLITPLANGIEYVLSGSQERVLHRYIHKFSIRTNTLDALYPKINNGQKPDLLLNLACGASAIAWKPPQLSYFQ